VTTLHARDVGASEVLDRFALKFDVEPRVLHAVVIIDH
jgi:hypothetical protein